MGTRGPAGFSDNVHRLRGTVPHAMRGAVKPAPVKLRPKAPEPPAWLDDEARSEWDRVLPTLDEQGLVSVVDRGILISYCVSWSVLVRAVAELKVAGHIANGARTPEFRNWKDAQAIFLMLAGKVLCTPADRLRMRLPEVTVSDPNGILD